MDEPATVHLAKGNGNAGGDTLVADVNPGAANSNPTDLTAIGSTLYFAATAAIKKAEPPRHDPKAQAARRPRY